MPPRAKRGFPFPGLPLAPAPPMEGRLPAPPREGEGVPVAGAAARFAGVVVEEEAALPLASASESESESATAGFEGALVLAA